MEYTPPSKTVTISKRQDKKNKKDKDATGPKDIIDPVLLGSALGNMNGDIKNFYSIISCPNPHNLLVYCIFLI